MTEQEIASLKEQMFGQTSTHTPPPDNVPPADTPPVDTPPLADTPPADTPPIDTTAQDDIVDANEFLKTNLGYDDWETAKADIAQLKALKENTPKPLEFANEESKRFFDLVVSGKTKEAKAILDLQEKLETADTLTPAEVIKLHIEQTNKHFKKADIEDVFEEKYTLPEKPIQEAGEEDDEFATRQEKYKASVEKINRRIERDAFTAKDELAKLKTEIKLPEIPTSENKDLEELASIKATASKVQEDNKVFNTALSTVTEKNVSFELSFNDEASKMKFDISYQGEKEGVEKAKAAAANYVEFLSETYYKEDGSPLADKFASDIYFLQNKEKIIGEHIKQAVNETKAWFLRNQKNIGDGVQRNFNMVQPNEIQLLKEQVFGKTG